MTSRADDRGGAPLAEGREPEPREQDPTGAAASLPPERRATGGGDAAAPPVTSCRFSRFIGIDYSGAETADSPIPGLAVFVATHDGREPEEVRQPVAHRRHWSRALLAEWLLGALREGPPTLVGIDHAFSFPLRYFERHLIPPDWPTFLDDFQRHWPTDGGIYVDFVRDGLCGHGAARSGDARWRRLVERRQGRAKSVFHFDVPGSVAKSTHAGLPWLRFLRSRLGARVHWWPFDGWSPPPGVSVVAEVYPSLWAGATPRGARNPHQHDAFVTTKWMRASDASGLLEGVFSPELTPAERTLARLEGWILGVP